MSGLPVKSQVCLALMRVGGRMVTGFDQRFAAHGITQAQFRVLLAVYFEGGDVGIAPSVLADHLLIERATVSLLESRLVDRGLLQRVPDPASRRSHKLRLTPAGGHILQELGHKANAMGEETLAVFDDAENAALLETLVRLERQLRGMAQRREAGGVAVREGQNA